VKVDVKHESNNQTQNEKDFEENMEHFNRRTEVIKPEDTEFYVEEVVMKELYDKNKIMDKMLFRRERELAHEIIQLISIIS
jgi:hypothetical protein